MLNNSDFIESEKNEAKEILESLSKYTEKNKWRKNKQIIYHFSNNTKIYHLF